jgi:bifunctional non-homologous end joining protein LigD
MDNNKAWRGNVGTAILFTPLNRGMLQPPCFVQPCIPVAAQRPPPGDAWVHELKLDGYRFQIIKDGAQVRLFSRSGLEWTDRHQGFAKAFLNLRCRSAVLDGELVMPDANGALNSNGLRWATPDAQYQCFFCLRPPASGRR